MLAIIELVTVGDLAHVDQVVEHTQDGLIAPDPISAVTEHGPIEAGSRPCGADVLVWVGDEDTRAVVASCGSRTRILVAGSKRKP